MLCDITAACCIYWPFIVWCYRRNAKLLGQVFDKQAAWKLCMFKNTDKGYFSMQSLFLEGQDKSPANWRNVFVKVVTLENYSTQRNS